MNNLFFDLPEHLQDKIIRMNPHPVVKLFDDFYAKYRLTVNKRNTTINKKQRKLWSRIYYNSEANYFSITTYSLYNSLETYCHNHRWDEDFETCYEKQLYVFLKKKYNYNFDYHSD